MGKRRIRHTGTGLNEFESFVELVYSKWRDENKDKEALRNYILKGWGTPDRMAIWRLFAESNWWSGSDSSSQ